ncbi:hypothetical protein SUGI_1224620 [Cryptomeria japonica]|uniref:Uncharacterized protein n=1 Tax=Cryptomeria japonica TaxID=3369 RepID=A0AAD3NJH0_CRYJA|nr:hypothetical protein SUGI_1224620 [Cryptomeria japonica]
MRFGREQLTRKQGAAGCFHFHNALSIVGVLPGVSVGAPTFLAGGGELEFRERPIVETMAFSHRAGRSGPAARNSALPPRACATIPLGYTGQQSHLDIRIEPAEPDYLPPPTPQLWL